MTENAAGNKKRALVRSQAPSVQLNSSDTSGITSFSTSASIEARTIFITGNPDVSTKTSDACRMWFAVPDKADYRIQDFELGETGAPYTRAVLSKEPGPA